MSAHLGVGMRPRSLRRRLCAVLAVLGCAALSLTASIGASAVGADTTVHVKPNASGGLDCNGLSPIQKPVKPSVVCHDPKGSDEGRLYENGHYIGHDEPSVRFISSQPGSGNDVTYTERLPLDPAARPTVTNPGHDVTHWFELSLAPWMSMTLCDPNSAPLNPCAPRSDSNAPAGNYPGAGAAFMELQFYPPGFGPFLDNLSCDNQHWCSALTIDSVECTTASCNDNCVEPVNWAFIQDNGVPAGPPSPQLTDNATYTPNGHTLLMKPGDQIRIHMFDAAIHGGHAFEVEETDLTTGQSGHMIASAANGFMNTDPFDCSGTPFNFEPEYNTARSQNIIPWGIGAYMINNQFEIGHFEPCSTITGTGTTRSEDFVDTFYKHCHGAYETQQDNADINEPNDAPCFPEGDTHGGTSPPNLVTGCDVFFNAVGDLDFDGSAYRTDWPTSTTPNRFPTPFLQQQPTTTNGSTYPQIQFVTDASASELNTDCDLESGTGCVLPPAGPGNFYPYWTLAKVGGSCVWEFGNMANGDTFGGISQYGTVRPNTIGAFASKIQANPSC